MLAPFSTELLVLWIIIHSTEKNELFYTLWISLDPQIIWKCKLSGPFLNKFCFEILILLLMSILVQWVMVDWSHVNMTPTMTKTALDIGLKKYWLSSLQIWHHICENIETWNAALWLFASTKPVLCFSLHSFLSDSYEVTVTFESETTEIESIHVCVLVITEQDLKKLPEGRLAISCSRVPPRNVWGHYDPVLWPLTTQI